MLSSFLLCVSYAYNLFLAGGTWHLTSPSEWLIYPTFTRQWKTLSPALTHDTWRGVLPTFPTLQSQNNEYPSQPSFTCHLTSSHLHLLLPTFTWQRKTLLPDLTHDTWGGSYLLSSPYRSHYNEHPSTHLSHVTWRALLYAFSTLPIMKDERSSHQLLQTKLDKPALPTLLSHYNEWSDQVNVT